MEYSKPVVTTDLNQLILPEVVPTNRSAQYFIKKILHITETFKVLLNTPNVEEDGWGIPANSPPGILESLSCILSKVCMVKYILEDFWS